MTAVPTTTLTDELATLFITATGTPIPTAPVTSFIPLPDAAPTIAAGYTTAPAAVFLVLFLVVSVGLSWRIHKTDKTENGRRVLISGAVFSWG
jgi:hypothetical protein